MEWEIKSRGGEKMRERRKKRRKRERMRRKGGKKERLLVSLELVL